MRSFALLHPFTSLPIVSYLTQTHDHMREKIDPVLIPWLAQHGFARLDRLIDFCPRAKFVAMDFAAYHGRLDLLEYLVGRSDSKSQPPLLFHNTWVVGATQGHISILDFLYARASRLHLRGTGDVFYQGGPDFVPIGSLLHAIPHVDQVAVLQWLFRVWVPSSDEQRKRVESHCLEIAVRNGFRTITQWLVPQLRARNQVALVELFGWVANAVVEDFAAFIDDKMRLICVIILNDCRQYDLVNLKSILTYVAQEEGRVREAKTKMLRQAMSHFRLDVLEWLMQQGMDDGDIRDVLYPYENQHTCSRMWLLTLATVACVGLRPLVYWACGDKANMVRHWKSRTSVAQLESFVDEIGGVVAIMPQLLMRLSTKKCDPSWFARVYDAWDAAVEATDEKFEAQTAFVQRYNKKWIRFKVALSMAQDLALLTRLAQISSVDLLKQVLANVTTKMPQEEAHAIESEALMRATVAANVAVVQWLTHRQIVQGRTLLLV
ncbi:Aste57867_1773 [Aphanomyces stellatus]|uniref:Aste57867_1773 protein n=1 Tax=Aphanomyces stellatus TaxID=120398 RepID=A0A485KA95_9STRA|nr:hypothetical protein As57867_001771 [Aphanomyces stellatus]VFT78982.1 Aste57867_1773 [Aphanomyces stellatus]